MATAGQVFYFSHYLEAVLPHVLFSNVMSSLLYRSLPCTLILQKQSSLANVFLECLEGFSLRCLKYEVFHASAQLSEIEIDPKREGAGSSER